MHFDRISDILDHIYSKHNSTIWIGKDYSLQNQCEDLANIEVDYHDVVDTLRREVRELEIEIEDLNDALGRYADAEEMYHGA